MHPKTLTIQFLETKALRQQMRRFIENADTSDIEFYTRAPFIIDCSEDGSGFTRATTAILREVIIDRYAKNKITGVGALPPTAKAYATKNLQHIYQSLDENLRRDVVKFLDGWRSERDRGAHQKAKTNPAAIGVDIILPMNEIKLTYTMSDIVFAL